MFSPFFSKILNPAPIFPISHIFLTNHNSQLGPFSEQFPGFVLTGRKNTKLLGKPEKIRWIRTLSKCRKSIKVSPKGVCFLNRQQPKKAKLSLVMIQMMPKFQRVYFLNLVHILVSGYNSYLTHKTKVKPHFLSWNPFPSGK